MWGDLMGAGFTILITDRNRHVRNFLRRELNQEGFIVEVATDGREVLRKINVDDPPDLLVLDLEIPHLGGLAILKRLQDHHPHLPVIIHTFPVEEASHPAVQQVDALVTKTGNTDCLKIAIKDVFRRRYSHRCAVAGETELQEKPLTVALPRVFED